MLRMIALALCIAIAAGCSGDTGGMVPPPVDGGAPNAGPDAGTPDAGTPDSGEPDAGTHTVVLNWTASTTTGVTYSVYRATTSGGPYAKIASALTATTYTDAQVSSGQTYDYVCTAVNADGESAMSSETTAVIPSP